MGVRRGPTLRCKPKARAPPKSLATSAVGGDPAARIAAFCVREKTEPIFAGSMIHGCQKMVPTPECEAKSLNPTSSSREASVPGCFPGFTRCGHFELKTYWHETA